MPRKHRRSSDPNRDIIIVTTSDGTRLRCSIATVGRGTEPRWMLLDTKGEQFVGPLATSDRSEAGVQRLVDEWWTQHREKPARGSRGNSAQSDADAR